MYSILHLWEEPLTCWMDPRRRHYHCTQNTSQATGLVIWGLLCSFPLCEEQNHGHCCLSFWFLWPVPLKGFLKQILQKKQRDLQQKLRFWLSQDKTELHIYCRRFLWLQLILVGMWGQTFGCYKSTKLCSGSWILSDEGLDSHSHFSENELS